MLIQSDKDSIKSYITKEHHYYCYNPSLHHAIRLFYKYTFIYKKTKEFILFKFIYLQKNHKMYFHESKQELRPKLFVRHMYISSAERQLRNCSEVKKKETITLYKDLTESFY